MFYENFSKVKDMNYKKVGESSFKGINADELSSDLSFGYSPLTYNFNFSKGALVDGIGIDKLKFKFDNDDFSYKELGELPNGYYPTVCWHFALWATDQNTYRSLFFVLGSDGCVYYNSLHTANTNYTKIDGLYFDDIPFVFKSKIDIDDVLIFVSKKNGSYVWMYPSIVNKINNMPMVESVCTFDNRFFATIKNNKGSIIFANDLNPINLNLDLMQGGEIFFNDGLGRCNKVVTFKGNLYVFRDFNIVKLSEYSNRDDYSKTNIFTSNGKIFENTICVCGDRIMYLASDGVYAFDGNTCKKLKMNIDSYFNGNDEFNAVAGYIDGNYYLSCKLDYGDGGQVVDGEWSNGNNRNNALIRLNLTNEEITLFRGYDIVGIVAINDVYKNEVCVRVREVGALYVLGMLDNSGAYFGEPLTKLWSTSITDLGEPSELKLVKDISFETRKDIELNVIADMKVKKFKVRGALIPQTIKLNIKCKKFGFIFKSKEIGSYISAPKIKVGYYGK